MFVSFLDVPDHVEAGCAATREIQNPGLENPGPRLSLHIAISPVRCHIDHLHASWDDHRGGLMGA